MLVHYFYQQGLFEVGDCLVKEAKAEVEAEVRAQSLEFHQLIESMKLKDIEPAMRWISVNRENLKQDGSKLEVKLVSLKYRDMLREGNFSDALKYARNHFPKYVPLHFEELKEFTKALVWTRGFENSPYTEIVSPSHWDKVTKELTNQYYNLLDQPSNSPLVLVLFAGLESLELGNELQFRSIFVCPLSRDESNEENHPLMMSCLHVLCKKSIMKLARTTVFRD